MKNVNKNLAKDSFALFVGTASESLVTMLVGMLLVRHFTDKAVFATYAQTMMLAQTLVAFVPLGFHRAIIYFLPRVPSQRAFVLQTTLATTGLVILAGGILLAMRGQLGVWLNNAGLSMTVPIIVALLWLMNLHSILLQILIGTKRTRLAGRILILVSIVYLAGIVLSVVAGLGLMDILLVIVALNAIKAFFVWWFLVRLPGDWSYVGDIPVLSQQFRYSVPLGLTSFLGVVGKVIDRFIVMAIFPPAVFAVYDRGATSIPFANLIPHSIANAMMPHLTKMHADSDIEGFRSLWHQSVVKTAIIIIPLTVMGWLAAPHLIVFMNTGEYAESTQYFRIYLFFLPLQLTAFPALFMAIGNTQKIFLISLVALLLKVGFCILFVMVGNMGLKGPAFGLVVAEVLSMMIYLYVLMGYFRVTFANVYPWKELFAVAGVALVAGAMVYPVSDLHIELFEAFTLDLNALMAILVIGVLYFVVFVINALLLKVITWQELVSLGNIVRAGR